VRGVCLTVRDKPTSRTTNARNRAPFASFNESKAYLLSRSQLAEHFTVCSSISAFL
jgi:hypothetical protein